MNPARHSWDALVGQYRLQPGRAPSIVGQRPVLAPGRLAGLLRGQRGVQVGRTLSSLFTLCSHAHRRAADMVLRVAQGGAEPGFATAAPVPLWLETARDHLRSIALDWPQRLPGPGLDGHALEWLRDCPLQLGTVSPAADAATAARALAALREWLQQRVLGQPIDAWLDTCRDPDALALWCQTRAERLPPARCLSIWRPLAQKLMPQTRLLELLDSDLNLQNARLRELAQKLVADPDFVQRPSWLGQCAETGAWSRLRHRGAALPARHSAWTRLSSRWLELVTIAAADPNTTNRGDPALLALGALELGHGQALSWVEMARGLLLHWVQLDPAGGLQDYRVVAPTEWNFHPQGALAGALAALPPGEVQAARTLAAAFDPCVACSV